MEIALFKYLSRIDLPIITEKLKSIPEMVVFSHNQPQFIIMTLQQYENKYAFAAKHQFETVYTQGCEKGSTQHTKIGIYVQETMRKLLLDNLLPASEIDNLTSSEYCSSTFGLSYPVLKRYNPSLPPDVQRRDANNKYNRYYKNTIVTPSGRYLLCSQWVEPLHRHRYEKWLLQWKQ